MGEIKFRAWFEIQEKMVNHEHLDIEYAHDEGFGFAFDNSLYGITDDGNVKGTLVYKLMQFTGLKDKNGTEIYEGDVLEFDLFGFGLDVEKGIVEFVNGSFDVISIRDYGIDGTKLSSKEHWYLGKLTRNNKDVKIIGNIYEHPHLLEVE